MKHIHLKIGTRTILETIEHYIMSWDFNNIDFLECENRLKQEKVTAQNIRLCDGGFNQQILHNWLENQSRFFEGYLFFGQNGERIGYLWLVKRGGLETWYKIKNIDIFLTDVFVYPEFRGNHYAREMIILLGKKLAKDNNKKLYLACRPYNLPALKTYQGIGFLTEKKKSFIRFCGVNIPYHIL